MSVYVKYSLAIILGTLSIVGLLVGFSNAPVPFAYLVSINIVTYLTFWYDKSIAHTGNRMRVPEVILHSLSFAGGPLASLLAQKQFRHKTQKWTFQGVPLIALALFLGIAAYLSGYNT